LLASVVYPVPPHAEHCGLHDAIDVAHQGT
jgi:hypothetical protein